MSYRTLKRLLGETSLERKCRLLFGTGLLLLIAGSFGLYGWLTVRLIYDQNLNIARSRVDTVVERWHERRDAGPDSDSSRPDQAGFEVSLPPEAADKPDITFQLYKTDPDAEADLRPHDPFEIQAANQIRTAGAGEVTRLVEKPGTAEYHYFVALRATKNCLACHHHEQHEVDDLLGMARISIPQAETRQALAKNNAFLISIAIVTAVLAMAAAWAIVRYVIVKPVLHLKDVSDEIARGTLDLRADIRTGDEFEELSHAFNRMLRYLITMQDELKEVNTEIEGKVDELAHVNLRLYETNKLKDEFLATMSHELRTPLNSILGFSEVLAAANQLTGKQQRFVSNIQTAGRDLLLLINDILDLAKIESGKLEVQPAELRLAELVDRQVDAQLPMAERKNIDLTTSIDLDVPLLWQDPGKLMQILSNFLSNAIKFTPEGGRVSVRASLSDERESVEIVIEDSGIGIPLEDQAAIFEKFRQGRSEADQKDAMTREFGGTGLGLSIVKELTRLLGGEVFLESEFGKGSAFTISIPLEFIPESDDEEEPTSEQYPPVTASR